MHSLSWAGTEKFVIVDWKSNIHCIPFPRILSSQPFLRALTDKQSSPWLEKRNCPPLLLTRKCNAKPCPLNSLWVTPCPHSYTQMQSTSTSACSSSWHKLLGSQNCAQAPTQPPDILCWKMACLPRDMCKFLLDTTAPDIGRTRQIHIKQVCFVQHGLDMQYKTGLNWFHWS